MNFVATISNTPTAPAHGPQWLAITAILAGLALLIFVFAIKQAIDAWEREERIRRLRREEHERANLEAQTRRHTLHVGHPTPKTTAGPVALKPHHLRRRAGGSMAHHS